MNKDAALISLLNKVNKVTSYHRTCNSIPKNILDDLVNAQLEYEEALKNTRPDSITVKAISREVNFVIIESETDHITIQDIGPWNIYMSVTNGVEYVVDELTRNYNLGERHLFCIDSEGNMDEIIHRNGKFISFKVMLS